MNVPLPEPQKWVELAPMTHGHVLEGCLGLLSCVGLLLGGCCGFIGMVSSPKVGNFSRCWSSHRVFLDRPKHTDGRRLSSSNWVHLDPTTQGQLFGGYGPEKKHFKKKDRGL